MWWNVNRRLDAILQNVSAINTIKPKIIFCLETSLGFDAIPVLKNYKKNSDEKIRQLNHGGIVVYVENSIAAQVFDITYANCFISFRLDSIPHIILIGAYIQPENSQYFCSTMFNDLSNIILKSNEMKIVPIIGGDINCRFGSLDNIFHGKGLRYSDNVDTESNFHGRSFGIDLCESTDIFPLNHLQYKQKTYCGDYTYFKGNKKSQIDYVFTNREGMKYVNDFCIPSENWHLSDHRPIVLDIAVPNIIPTYALICRARDLNYEFDPQLSKPVRHLGVYDARKFESELNDRFQNLESMILNEIANENIDNAINIFDFEIEDIYRSTKLRVPAVKSSNDQMVKANEQFEIYRKCIKGEILADEEEMWNNYQESRNKVTKEICKSEAQRWHEVTSDTDSKRMWNKIDWKGGVTKDVTNSPIFEDLTLHFERLHENGKDDLQKISELKSDVYIPEMDKPITKDELDNAMKLMKNGGYDHKIDMFRKIVNVMSPIILLFLNILFYIAYPMKLAISLLIAIPKKGNLSLPKNYRGIQMLRALAVLYDRIITVRLESWIKVNDVQSAFQKLRSTIQQIFTIRLLIEIAKKTNTTLYIGLFDLEKAFDKVSRYQLLRKLVILGIGNCMLQALKMLYMCTFCVMSYGREYSKKFRTFSGIRQGAASSALLFIAFIDDLVDYLNERCPPEPVLDTLHCLLHADDTAILSTDRTLFTNKCNHMLDFFAENSLSLNLSKSGFLVINGNDDDKRNLELKNGMLEYKSILTYLGVKISDSGCLKDDIAAYIKEKRSNVSIKFGNFCRKQFLAPLDIKMKVLNTCVSAALIYASETWAGTDIKQVEVIFRHGLKTAMSIRSSVNNEIVYTESGEFPLRVRIVKQQLKFWLSLQAFLEHKPQHYISKLINLGNINNIKYLQYYKDLQQQYTDPANCERILKNSIKMENDKSIQEAFVEDEYSRLGTYCLVNPTLSKPEYQDKLEFQRVLITRYRTGSNNLAIEKGRIAGRIPREERLCTCNSDIQSLKHVLLHCPLLNYIRTKHQIIDVNNGVMNDNFLVEMESLLGIK